MGKANIVLATSQEMSDDPIAAFALEKGVSCHRGSLDNVARRFYEAAVMKGWDFAVRINGDNIFVDTDLLNSMIQIARTGQYDFVSNVKGRTFPKGMSIEIVNLEHYHSLLPLIEAGPSYREHVTLYLYEHEKPESYHFILNTAWPQIAGFQMALDTMEDFQRTEKIIQQLELPHYLVNMEGLVKYMSDVQSQ